MILGIDASTKRTGYCIMSNSGDVQSIGVIAANGELLDRINKMVKEIEKIILENEITDIVLEEVKPEFGGGNIQTHKALLYLQGAIALNVHNKFKKKITFYYPSEWRAECGIKNGRGVKRSEAKSLDIKFIKEKFDIETDDDQADAIGLAYCHHLKNFPKTMW